MSVPAGPNVRMTEEERLRVHALFPLPFNNRGVSHICHALCRELSSAGAEARMYTPRGWPTLSGGGVLRQGLPIHLRYMPWKWVSERGITAAEAMFERELGGAIAYVWAEPTSELSRRLSERGAVVLREKYNCHKATAREILDREYEGLGLKPRHSITDAAIAKEREELELASGVVCPSEQVKRSMLREGVPESKLIETSYGWEPGRFTGTSRRLAPVDVPTVVFVGLICVRKGAHRLLRAWARANPRARLVLAGDMEPAIRESCADVLNREDVVVVPFTDDIASVFRSADLFAFPSVEEGDPLVSYEAMAQGLPMLVSPMGAGRGVRHGIEGQVIDPHDTGAWEAALLTAVASRDLREQWSKAARERAQEFTWRKVAARLGERLRDFVREPVGVAGDQGDKVSL